MASAVTRRMLAAFLSGIEAIWRSSGGAAALEFAIVALPLLTFLFALLDIGFDGFFQATLDDAVRNATRQLQIDGPARSNGSGLVSAVCSEFAMLAPNCQSNVTYNVQVSTVTAGFSSLLPGALPASGQFSDAFYVSTQYADGVNVLVQVAYPLPFSLPFFSTLITGTGTVSIMSSAAVRVEPF